MTKIKQAIIVENRFKEVLAHMPEFINPDTTTAYSYHIKVGPEEDINPYLKKSKEPYPLIWLTYPFIETHKINKVECKNISFVIAVKGNSTKLLDDRFDDVYVNRLMPMFSTFKHVIEKANIIKTTNEYDVVKFPNYTKKDKNATIDIWDAIKVTFDCVVDDKCLILKI
tara:strand:+ start:149 stop:655 length:507 start_codon:yes stop_codon:yes gene_type:complete